MLHSILCILLCSSYNNIIITIIIINYVCMTSLIGFSVQVCVTTNVIQRHCNTQDASLYYQKKLETARLIPLVTYAWEVHYIENCKIYNCILYFTSLVLMAYWNCLLSLLEPSHFLLSVTLKSSVLPNVIICFTQMCCCKVVVGSLH